MKKYKSQLGVTLLEVILGLAIGATVIALSIKLVSPLASESNLQAEQYRIDQVFLAMGNYYRANCGIQGMATATPIPGALVTTTTPVVVTLANLSTYLPANWTTTQLPISFISYPAGVGSEYVLQFNLTIGTQNVNCSAADCGTQTQAALTSPIASLIWRAQVAVKISDTAHITTYAGLFAADCISHSSGSGIATCSSLGSPRPAPTAADVYLVWERLPSFISPSMSSSFWVSMPALKNFNLQYTHDQMYELTSQTYNETSSTLGANQQYYLCGD